MISSDIFNYSHKFLKGANFGTSMPVYATNAAHDGFGFGVIKVPTVPSQKIIDVVYRGYGNMQCIVQGLGWQGFPLEKHFGQRDDATCNGQFFFSLRLQYLCASSTKNEKCCFFDLCPNVPSWTLLFGHNPGIIGGKGMGRGDEAFPSMLNPEILGPLTPVQAPANNRLPSCQ